MNSLSDEEQEMLRRGALCPWLNEMLCAEMWGMPQAGLIWKNWNGRGFSERTEKRKYGKQRRCSELYVYLLYGKYDEKNGYSEHFWIELAGWYEKNGFVREAFLCLKESGNSEEYQSCLIRHYQMVPFIEIPLRW